MNNTTKTISLAPVKPSRNVFAAFFSTAIILAALFWTQNLSAYDLKININQDPVVQDEAASFIKDLANRALTSLNRKDYTLTDQEHQFREILTQGFNVKYIGKISLGRHRKHATAEQLHVYYDLFPDYLVRVYTTRLTKLDTRKVNIGKVLPNGKRDMYVRTKVINGDEKSYDVDWRVRPEKDQGSYKIVDVKIEGISMARTQRDDFTSRITESGMDGLVSYMQAIIRGDIEIPQDPKETAAAN